MKIYKFMNKIKNRQYKWPRYFVALSLRDAIDQAKEFEQRMNEANYYMEELLFTFDYDNVKVIENKGFFNKRGYLDLSDKSN